MSNFLNGWPQSPPRLARTLGRDKRETGHGRPGDCRCALRLRFSRLRLRASSPSGPGSARRSQCRRRRSARAKSFIASPMPRFAPARTRSGRTLPSIPARSMHDLAQLKQITNCVRTYSVDHGLDQIPEIARKHGLKVMQGLWLSSLPDLSRKQVEVTIALANRYPDVIQAVVVGNEVLLRGEMSAPALAQTIRAGEGAGADAGHLCGRVGVLAAQPRPGGGGRFHHHPHLAVLGGRPDPGAGRGASCGRHPQTGRGGVSRQGSLARRVRLAERRPHARGRLAVARQPGAGAARGFGAGAARRLPGQRDRGLRSALEAPARRHRRRPLGAVRCIPAPRQIHLGGAGLQPSALALAGGRRRRAGGVRLRCRLACGARPHPAAGCVAAHCRQRAGIRSAGRIDHRECAAGEPYRGRLAAFAGVGHGRADDARHRRCGDGFGNAHSELCANARSLAAASPSTDRARLLACSFCCWWCWRCSRHSVWSSSRATATCHSRRSWGRAFRCCWQPHWARARAAGVRRRRLLPPARSSSRRSTSCSTRPSPTGRRYGFAPGLVALAVTLLRVRDAPG